MKKLNDNNLFRLIRDYLTVYLPDQRCCSPNTIKSYRETLSQLFDYVTAEKKILLTDDSNPKRVNNNFPVALKRSKTQQRPLVNQHCVLIAKMLTISHISFQIRQISGIIES